MLIFAPALTMTPEQKHALHDHVQAIAQILYENTPTEQLNTLGGIEQAVRQQMQKHVTPEVGIFLSQRQRAPQQDEPAPSKASLESCG
jgi:hypothetical protein